MASNKKTRGGATATGGRNTKGRAKRGSDKRLPASALPGRRLSPEDRRAQIIDFAEELFKTRPYAELSVGDVANAARITEGLVYHYFPSKEALFSAAYERRAAELLRFCLPDRSLPFVEQVARGVAGYIDFVEAHSIVYRNMFKGPTAAEDEFQRLCEETRQRIVDHFVEAIGLGGQPLPATRLSLRGYIGYSEATVLQWLEHRDVPRATLERMLFGLLGAAVRVGLSSEATPPLSDETLDDLDAAYRRHLSPLSRP
jgi:AcrR family transcriptional regulator